MHRLVPPTTDVSRLFPSFRSDRPTSTGRRVKLAWLMVLLWAVPTVLTAEPEPAAEAARAGETEGSVFIPVPKVAKGSVPTVTPGFPNVAQTPGAILSGLNAPEQGRTAVLAYHNGILYTVPRATVEPAQRGLAGPHVGHH